jgi:hypothetical protein
MKIQFDIKKWIADDRIRFSALFLMLGLISWLWQKPETNAFVTPPPTPEIDESLPVGLSAATVELVNNQAISAMIGSTAIVDLFTTESQTLKPAKKVARRVRLARSPGDAERFFIVVSEDHLREILSHPGPYFATVQSRKRKDTLIVTDTVKAQSKIHYQEEL